MLRIRLQRLGRKKKPSYRVIVSERQKDTQAGSLEILGRYNPMAEPKELEFNSERVKHWLSVGAQPSNTVHNLLIKAGVIADDKKKMKSVTITKKRQTKLEAKVIEKAEKVEKKKAAEEAKLAEAKAKKAEEAAAKVAEAEAKAAAEAEKPKEETKVEEAPAPKVSEETRAEEKTAEEATPAPEEKKEEVKVEELEAPKEETKEEPKA